MIFVKVENTCQSAVIEGATLTVWLRFGDIEPWIEILDRYLYQQDNLVSRKYLS